MRDASAVLSELAKAAISNTDLLADEWDVIVVGAGPAGSLSAKICAEDGLKTLLVEKSIFPRRKVCGCCLSGQALQLLDEQFPPEFLDALHAKNLRTLRVFSSPKAQSTGVSADPQHTDFALPAGKSLSRSLFDAALAVQSINCGAVFAHGIRAQVEPKTSSDAHPSDCLYVTLSTGSSVMVDLQHEAEQDSDSALHAADAGAHDKESLLKRVRAKVVVVADGLGGRTLCAYPEMNAEVVADSRVGAGTISGACSSYYEDGIIYMIYGSAGYMGLVRLEDGSADIAAAFDPSALRRAGNMSKAAETIFAEAALPAPDDLHGLVWRGTVALTRRRPRIGRERIFVVGDAASYVEPFTGEGIAWALQSAKSVAPLVSRAVSRWDPLLIHEWEREHRHNVRRLQTPTKIVASVLRNEELARALGKLVDMAPPVGRLLVNLVSGADHSGRNRWSLR